MLEVINGQLKGTFKIYVDCLSQDFSNPDSFYDYLQHCIDTQCSSTGIKLEGGGENTDNYVFDPQKGISCRVKGTYGPGYDNWHAPYNKYKNEYFFGLINTYPVKELYCNMFIQMQDKYVGCLGFHYESVDSQNDLSWILYFLKGHSLVTDSVNNYYSSNRHQRDGWHFDSATDNYQLTSSSTFYSIRHSFDPSKYKDRQPTVLGFRFPCVTSINNGLTFSGLVTYLREFEIIYSES